MKPSLALVHGWGMPGQIFDDLVARLNDKFSLNIIKLPGDKDFLYEGEITLGDFAKKILNQIKHKSHIVGWSFGGQIALKIAELRPDIVKSLIIICSTPKFVADDSWQVAIKPSVLQNFAKVLENDYAKTIEDFINLQTMHLINQREYIKSLRKIIDRQPDFKSIKAQFEILANSDLRQNIKNIKHKSLWIMGDKDMLCPHTAGKQASSMMPDARYELIKGAGHIPFISHQIEFDKILTDFIK